MTTGEAQPQSDSIVPLRKNRDFQILWSAQAMSGLGSTVSGIAYPLLILALTGSATYAGLMGTLEMVFLLLATLPAGVFADRFDRRKIMVGCDVVRAVVLGAMAVLVLTDRAAIWMILVAGSLTSIGDGLFNPAAGGALKQLVPASQLAAAAAAREGRNAAAAMVGPPLAGVLFTVGRAVPFLFDALSYLVGAAALLFIRRPFQRERGAEHAEPMWKGATAGFVFIFGNPVLRALMSWAVLMNMAFAGVPLVLIAHATKVGANTALTGLVITLLGAGVLLGSFAATWLVKVLRPSQVIHLSAAALPIGLTAAVFTSSPIVQGIVFGVVVFMIPPGNALLGGYMGAIVPDHLQGRVNAAQSLAAMGLRPVGPIAFGIVFDHFGTGWAFAAAAGIALLAGLFTLDRDVRHMRRPEELAVE
ncbi:MAG TPA: MFS transporter [Phytomonospora sp.]